MVSPVSTAFSRGKQALRKVLRLHGELNFASRVVKSMSASESSSVQWSPSASLQDH